MKIDTKIVIESTDGFIPETFVIVLYEAGLLTYSYLSFTPSHRILTVANLKDIFKSLQHRVVLLIFTVFPFIFFVFEKLRIPDTLQRYIMNFLNC